MVESFKIFIANCNKIRFYADLQIKAHIRNEQVFRIVLAPLSHRLARLFFIQTHPSQPIHKHHILNKHKQQQNRPNDGPWLGTRTLSHIVLYSDISFHYTSAHYIRSFDQKHTDFIRKIQDM